MGSQNSFAHVCRLLSEGDGSLTKAVDTLLGPALVIASMAGPIAGLPIDGASALSLLDPKSALSQAGSQLIDAVLGDRFDAVLGRFERLQAAHSLVAFSAFFEATEKLLPKVSKAFALDDALLSTLAEGVTTNAAARDAVGTAVEEEIELPHPADDRTTQERQLEALYASLTTGYRRYIHCTQAWAESSPENRGRVEEHLEKLPKLALVVYRAQYIELARRYPEFLAWANMLEHKETRKVVRSLTGYWKSYAAIARTAADRADTGFRQLNDALDHLPETLGVRPTKALLELRQRYEAHIQRPIIDDEEETSRTGSDRLRYPTRAAAFIPQAFRVIRTRSGARLEDEATWKERPIRNDLGPYLISHLLSPHSASTPLLILGDPGSGKSLLTQVLAATLSDSGFTPIRVELRNLEADDVRQQVEEQISADTNGREIRWPDLAEQLKDSNPVLLLDGYDELLQASGLVYADYLLQARRFQDDERINGRSLRIVVTSRITLIDKSRLPAGSTVLRLEHFDMPRIEAWSNIWNETNSMFFARKRIESFHLPSDKQIGELAQQPLLLLLLAIYDSHENGLRHARQLARTKLYETLLWRFVQRECLKSSIFRSFDSAQQHTHIEEILLRLGVAALSMFNRRSLLIRTDELERDLILFNREKAPETQHGRALKDGEKLLGSFFFVHESRSRSKGLSATTTESAFQFLHNTFGEYLTARSMIYEVTQQCMSLHALLSTPTLKAELERKLTSAGYGQAWHASLSFTPLFSRPVIIEMAKEIVAKQVLSLPISPSDVSVALDRIVRAELLRILDQHSLQPTLEDSGSAKRLPLLGQLATYSANLVILRILDGDDWSWPEATNASDTKERCYWDQLATLWRSWFSNDSLCALAGIISIRRRGGAFSIRLRSKFEARASLDALDSAREVGRAVGDGSLAGLAGLLSWRPHDRSALDELDWIAAELEREGIDLFYQILQSRLATVGPSLSEASYRELCLAMNSSLHHVDFDNCWPASIAVTMLWAIGRQRGFVFEVDRYLLERLLHALPGCAGVVLEEVVMSQAHEFNPEGYLVARAAERYHYADTSPMFALRTLTDAVRRRADHIDPGMLDRLIREVTQTSANPELVLDFASAAVSSGLIRRYSESVARLWETSLAPERLLYFSPHIAIRAAGLSLWAIPPSVGRPWLKALWRVLLGHRGRIRARDVEPPRSIPAVGVVCVRSDALSPKDVAREFFSIHPYVAFDTLVLSAGSGTYAGWGREVGMILDACEDSRLADEWLSLFAQSSTALVGRRRAWINELALLSSHYDVSSSSLAKALGRYAGELRRMIQSIDAKDGVESAERASKE